MVEPRNCSKASRVTQKESSVQSDMPARLAQAPIAKAVSCLRAVSSVRLGACFARRYRWKRRIAAIAGCAADVANNSVLLHAIAITICTNVAVSADRKTG